jgi:hypothetical protein
MDNLAIPSMPKSNHLNKMSRNPPVSRSGDLRRFTEKEEASV